MKKISILGTLFLLAACDRPMAQSELLCTDINVETMRSVEHNVSVRIYDDYALMSVDGGEYKRLPLVAEEDRFSEMSLEFYDDVQGFVARVNKDEKMISEFVCTLPGMAMNQVTGCSVSVPFKSDKYPAPTETEKCIRFITDNVYLKDDKDLSDGLVIRVHVNEFNSRNDRGGVRFYTEYVDIPADVAIGISPNWDYKNMKLYDERDGVQPHEQDACTVRYELQQYMAHEGLDKIKKVYLDEIAENK